MFCLTSSTGTTAFITFCVLDKASIAYNMISATKESKRQKGLVHFRNKLHIRLVCTNSVPQQRQYKMQKEVSTLNFEPFKRNAVSIFSVGGSNGVFHLHIINFRGRVDTCFAPFFQPGRLLTLHLVP